MNELTKEIFKKAAELGKLIKEDERITALEAAKTAYEQDEEIATLTTEYDVQQKALAAAYGEKEPGRAVYHGGEQSHQRHLRAGHRNAGVQDL